MKKRPQTAQVSVLKLKLFSLATGAGSPEQHMQIKYCGSTDNSGKLFNANN